MPPYILTLIMAIPLLASGVILFQKKNSTVVWTSAIASAVTTILCFGLLFFFDYNNSSLQYVHFVSGWLISGKLQVDYLVGLDGVGLLLFGLTSFLFFLSSMASWTNISRRVKEFHIALLTLEFAVLGVFAAGNMVLFYVFWELMVIPMTLMIGIWGGEFRVKAAVKYFLFSMAGSVLMLAGLLVVYKHTGTISIEAITAGSFESLSYQMQLFLFASFAIAFSIKIPIFPLHTWMPDVHTEAPTVGSVDLAGVLLKLGAYGFIRFLIPFFPSISLEFREVFAILSVVGIVYGAWVATIQKDAKRIIAYSSLSHLGFCVLGLMSFTESGVKGSMLQLLSHGVSTGMLFIMIGMIYERTHTRMVADFGGIAKEMPIFSAFFLIAVFSSAALPGTNGFIGEFMILLGAIKSNLWLGIIAGTAVVWSAIYLLWFVKRFLFGTARTTKVQNLKDLNLREIAILIPLTVTIFWIGLYPKLFLDILEPSTRVYLNAGSVGTIAKKKNQTQDIGSNAISPGILDYAALGHPVLPYEERMGSFLSPKALRVLTNEIFPSQTSPPADLQLPMEEGTQP